MPSKRIVLTSLALTGLLCGVAGCSSAESGTPVAGESAVSTPTAPESTTAPPTSSQATTESQAPSVDRPKPIDLTAVDLCRVLAGMPLRDFKLDGDRPPLAGESSLFPGAKDCFANGRQNNVSLLLVGVTDQGAKEFAEFANVAAKSDVVAAGYPLTVLTPQAPASCLGVLDVDDGQMLYISYGLASPREQPVTPQAQLCRTVPAIASAAVAGIG
jgi:Protein of unknown function (DUF3558)